VNATRAASEWQQGDVPGALDGLAQPALMPRANPGHAARENLAALLHKLRENVGALVVDEVHLLDAKLADFLLAKILALAAARPPRTSRAATAWATFATATAVATGSAVTA
jgi:hypothetical protein